MKYANQLTNTVVVRMAKAANGEVLLWKGKDDTPAFPLCYGNFMPNASSISSSRFGLFSSSISSIRSP